jgi:hypothetical protein
MKKQTLHEISKLLAGLVLGKIFFLWWMSAAGLFPVRFWGITFPQSTVVPALIFNIALFIIFVHYGWNIGKMPTVRERTYLTIAGTIFLIVALLHLWRLIFGGLDFIVFGWVIPVWFSWIGVIVAGFLSYMSFRLRRHLSH